MPIIKKIETSFGMLGIWQLSESSEELLRDFDFSLKEKAEFKKRTSENRKKEYLASRMLLKELVGKKTHINYSKTGQPGIDIKNRHISISHSPDFLGILISDKAVGLDIENTNRKIERIEKRFLCKEEQDFLKQTENPAIEKILYWSAKEAIFKCSAEAGIQFNEQIRIKPFQLKKTGKCYGTLNTSDSTVRYKLEYFFLEKNVVICCTEM
jgi:phosphopantetheinyl transferase